ncbi:MAG: S41 family peptidase [Bacillota bacterium]|jgi:carboxyl-terminal processing protease
MKKFIIVLLCCMIMPLSACGQNYHGDSIDAQALANHIQAGEEDFLVESLDLYASYLSAEEYDLLVEEFNGEFAGIGVYFTQNPDDKTCIFFSVMPNYPADKAGLEAGDQLVKIDGEGLDNLSQNEIATILRGEEGTKVKLTIFRPSTEKTFNVYLTREIIKNVTVTGQFIEGKKGLAYISVVEFTSKTATEFWETYQDLKNQEEIRGLIIDLRNNGGGSVLASLQMLEYFIPKDNVLMHEQFKEGLLSTSSSGKGQIQVPVACLQNMNTASASEIFIGAMKDYAKAVIIGEQSFGKGITQNISSLSNGRAIRYTQSRYLTPNRYDLHGIGIMPDYEVKMTGDDVFKRILEVNPKVDPQLTKAVELLS